MPEFNPAAVASQPFPDVPASHAESQAIAAAFEAACLAELQAIKPGNVHIFADGHGMVVGDFVKSAQAAASVIALPGLTVGQRILWAVNATQDAVGSNTNLGIVLLAAPLVQSELLHVPLHDVLANLTLEDAEDAFRAIVLASPAGLGKSPRYDVHDAPKVTLLKAMQEAASRDRIAWQYANDYEDIFNFGLIRYGDAYARWGNEAWAATAVYLGFMSHYLDSHVVRKHGEVAATSLLAQAKPHESALLECENPKNYLADLLRFDAQLKQHHLNPGTSADLTVTTILAASLENT